MQRVDRVNTDRLGGDPPVSGAVSETSASVGVAAASGIITLAQPFSQSLPLLDGVLPTYSHEERAELLYALCTTLVQEGLGSMQSWNKCGRNALVFARHAIMEAIGEERYNLFQRNSEYHLSICDTLDEDYSDEILPDGKLALKIECSAYGYLKIGPAVDALEESTKGLGAAFYWELLRSIYRVMRVYDHEDAFQYEESQREMAADEEDVGQHYEFPDVKESIPACIRPGLNGEYKGEEGRARRLLSEAMSGRYKSWIGHLRQMQRLSRLHTGIQRTYPYTSNYDWPPLPSLLISFQQGDAIMACFDEESRYMLECSSEPALLVVFDPKNRAEVRCAHRSAAGFILFNQALLELVEELQEWEKGHGDTSLDRGEPSLHAA